MSVMILCNILQVSSPKVPCSIVSPVKPLSAGNNSLPVLPPKKASALPHLSTAGSGLAPLVLPPQSSLTSITSTGPGSLLSQSQPTTPTGGLGPMRRRVSDKCNLPISAGKGLRSQYSATHNTQSKVSISESVI